MNNFEKSKKRKQITERLDRLFELLNQYPHSEYIAREINSNLESLEDLEDEVENAR